MAYIQQNKILVQNLYKDKNDLRFHFNKCSKLI